MTIDPVSLAITAALTAANMAITASRTIEGPRLDDLSATVGDYGAPVPRVWGKRRLQPPVFWCEDLREVKRRRKTKGGKFNEYTYYGTWAVALTDREIGGVTRIWFDTHLVFDLTGTGPVTPFDFGTTPDSGKGGGAAGAGAWSFGESLAIYPGTMTQEPDERMTASVEALNGPGTCPAYRGIAYVVFKDVPLEKIGNRIPQVSVEFASATTALWLYEEVDADGGGSSQRFSADFSLLWTSGTTSVAVFDVAARAQINKLDFNPNNTESVAPLADGTAIGIIDGTDKPYLLDVYGGATGPLAPNIGLRDLTSAIDLNGEAHWLAKSDSTSNYYLDGALIGSDKFGQFMFADMDGALWMATHDGVDDTAVTFEVIAGVTVGPATVTVAGLPSFANAISGAFHYRDATLDQFIFTRNGITYAVSRADGTVLQTYSTSHGVPHYTSIRPGSATFWGGFREFDSRDLSVLRAITPSTAWGLAISTTAQVAYDPVNNALVRNGASGPQWLYLDRVDGATVTLEQIAGEIAAAVGVEDYDFSDLDQEVRGWSVTQGPASAMLEPLLDAFDADIAPHEFGIVGRKRGGAAGATLATERFAGSPRYTVRVRQSAELPLALTYQFADVNADQQPNNVRVDRPGSAVSGRDERTIDLGTFASDADTMRGLAERHFRRIWGERREAELALTLRELTLEPGDVRVLELDGETMRARCVRTTISAAGTIETAWRYDHASFAALSGAAGAEMDGRPESAVTVPLLSRGFFLDIPYLADSHDQTAPLVYFAAGPLADGAWPGATAYEAVDGEYSDEVGTVASSAAAVWGYANAALADANPNLWDRLSEVNVTLQTGTLTGCTEAQIDADAERNLLLIGSELVQFTTATLEGDGTWTLSGFKRGRRGTEWACSTHAARDVVLLMNTAQRATQGLSEVSTDLAFKMITAGRSTGFPVRIEPFTGASLKPYAPCQLTAVQSGSDWELSGIRRTRVGGAWTGGSAIPLSEASEEYEVEVMDGATVKRTFTLADITETGSGFTVTYTAAQQTTDFGAPLGSAPVWRAYQISDAVGRGFMAEAA